MSLRRILSVMIITLAGLAFLAAVSLTTLTAYLHRTTLELTAAHESIRLAQQTEVDLLAYARTQRESSRATIESRLRDNLSRMEQYTGSEAEKAALARAKREVEAYFQHLHQFESNPDPAELETAFDSLRELVDINIGQADGVDADAVRWDNIADRIGLVVAGLLVVGITLVLLWLWTRAFQPVLHIRNAMRSFATGDRTSRAPLDGPEELRSIAAQFNEMAAALARQRDNQLEFLAGVAHDLRNPLSALKLSALMIPPHEPLPAEERLRTVLAIVTRQIDQLDRMVGDLLDASRIEAGRLELRIEEVDARSIARGVFELFRTAAPDRRIHLKLPETSIPIWCDPLRIEQVLTNLVTNAVKYSGQDSDIELALQDARQSVIFFVSDKGAGIPPEEIPFVFEPFRRGADSKRKAPGVGMGLSVARRIVEAHQGRIDVESQYGIGTTFQVCLPLNHKAA